MMELSKVSHFLRGFLAGVFAVAALSTTEGEESDAIPPMPNKITIVVRDKNSQLPIGRFEGVLSNDWEMIPARFIYSYPTFPNELTAPSSLGDGAMFFRSQNESGELSIPSVPLSNSQVQREVQRHGIRDSHDSEPEIVGMEMFNDFCIGLAAPGYAIRNFAVPIAMIKGANPIALDMEPEAVVIGRVVLGNSDVAVTTNTLKAAGEARSDKIRMGNEEKDYFINIALTNRAVDDFASYRSGIFFRAASHTHTDAEGRFRMDSIRPHEHWNLEIEAWPYPPIIRRNLQLKPGINDLGDLQIQDARTLEGRIVDQSGRGIPEVIFSIANKNSDPTLPQYGATTDAGGTFHFKLTQCPDDRLLARIFPPWGRDTFKTKDQICAVRFDRIIDVSKIGGLPEQIRITQGHTLRLRLPSSAITKKIAQFYNGKDAFTDNFSRTKENKSRPAFVLRRVNIVGLEQNNGNFLYHQQRLVPRDFSLDSRARIVEMPNVPAGRMGLRIDGGYQYRPGDLVDGTEAYWTELTGFPVTYMEFDMPDSEFTLKTRFYDSEVILNLPEGDQYTRGSLPIEQAFVLLERKEPICTGLWGDFRNVMLREMDPPSITAESHLAPFFALHTSFARPTQKRGIVEYRPAHFRFVPPGDYRITVHRTFQEATGGIPPVYQSEIQLAEGNGILNITIPVESK